MLQRSLRDTEKIAFLRGLRQIRQLSPEPVPDAALQDIDGKPVVFTPAGPGQFDRHFVRLGLRSGGFTEIVEGLPANATVVTDGSFWLKAALTQSSIPDAG